MSFLRFLHERNDLIKDENDLINGKLSHSSQAWIAHSCLLPRLSSVTCVQTAKRCCATMNWVACTRLNLRACTKMRTNKRTNKPSAALYLFIDKWTLRWTNEQKQIAHTRETYVHKLHPSMENFSRKSPFSSLGQAASVVNVNAIKNANIAKNCISMSSM